MTELVLARHGETIWHAENRYAGSTDIPLSSRGVEQARQLAAWAADSGLAGLWCSPQSRCLETARHISAATGLPARQDERLRELDFGAGEGVTTAQMEQRFPERLRAFRHDPVAHHLPDGEDPRLAVGRALEAVTEISAAVPEGRVLVVSHNTLIRLCLCSLLGIPLADYRRVFPAVHNTARTMLRLANGHTALLQFNAPLSCDDQCQALPDGGAAPQRRRNPT